MDAVYYERHCRCPGCGNLNVEQTTGPSLRIVPGAPDANTNRANCNPCGWQGIVHDLKPRTVPLPVEGWLEEIRERAAGVEEKWGQGVGGITGGPTGGTATSAKRWARLSGPERNTEAEAERDWQFLRRAPRDVADLLLWVSTLERLLGDDEERYQAGYRRGMADAHRATEMVDRAIEELKEANL